MTTTIDRVTDGTGTVADSSLAALKSHTVPDSGERIPSLEEVFEALPPTVELKDAGIAADVLEAVDGAENRVVATSVVPPARPVGLEIRAWTVERPALARLLESREVDCVSADRPLCV